MKDTIKARFTAFAAAIVVLAALIGWAAYASWRETANLQTPFSRGHLKSFEIADHIQDSILKLNNSLVRFELKHDPRDLTEFEKSSGELNEWIDAQKPSLPSSSERAILEKIDAAYDVFLEIAKGETQQREQPEEETDESKLKHIGSSVQASISMLELGYQLEDAHRKGLENLMQESRRSVLHLQWLIFGSLFTLIGTLVWLATMVYREMIAPLKLQLIESRAIIERQEKLASLGVLAAGVAHEIRNPLTAITARLFRHEKTLGKDPSKLEDVRIIGKELNRLEQIIKEFLQFARPNEPVLLPVKATDVLTGVSDLFTPHLKGQSINLHVENGTDAFVKADAKQLQQVLINLVTNASESIGQGGEITLRARTGNARLSGRPMPAVILEVEDSGKGISPEVQRRLFDPFFSTKEGGTGLGLSISARIIEKHGGLLEFQTQLNRGTTFGIVLPIYLENANPS